MSRRRFFGYSPFRFRLDEVNAQNPLRNSEPLLLDSSRRLAFPIRPIALRSPSRRLFSSGQRINVPGSPRFGRLAVPAPVASSPFGSQNTTLRHALSLARYSSGKTSYFAKRHFPYFTDERPSLSVSDSFHLSIHPRKLTYLVEVLRYHPQLHLRSYPRCVSSRCPKLSPFSHEDIGVLILLGWTDDGRRQDVTLSLCRSRDTISAKSEAKRS